MPLVGAYVISLNTIANRYHAILTTAVAADTPIPNPNPSLIASRNDTLIQNCLRVVTGICGCNAIIYLIYIRPIHILEQEVLPYPYDMCLDNQLNRLSFYIFYNICVGLYLLSSISIGDVVDCIEDIRTLWIFCLFYSFDSFTIL